MEQSALPPTLLWSFLDKKDKFDGFASFRVLSTCVKASEIQGKDGGWSVPHIKRSTQPFATCNTSLWVRQSQQRGSNSLMFGVAYTFAWGQKMRSKSRNLLMEQVSSKTVTPFAQRIKQKVRRRYPRPSVVSVTLLWAHNLSCDVGLDEGRGSEVYLDKRGVFVVFLVL